MACTSIFVVALGIRALHWQDSYVELGQKGPWMSDHARHYTSEALRILNEGGILIPREPVDPGDARTILHPPGYSAFMAGIFAVWGNSDFAVRLSQVVFDAFSALMVFFIAAELFKFGLAVIAALLAALSPHFAHYSLWTSPDTLCVLPILIAVYLIIRTIKRPRLLTIAGAGVMVGLSCWLRANGLLLTPFLVVVVLLLLDKGKRLRYAGVLVAATILVVSPITIRNWILFHHFIPLSIAGGENLVVGIADYDREGRFGMPTSDVDAAAKDALWYNRPEYAQSPWLPDGVERDKARYSRGLEVIRANPGWFLGVMCRRAFFMLTYNGSRGADWPFSTSTVPVVSAAPRPLHLPENTAAKEPVWSSLAPGLLADGFLPSQQTRASLDGDGRLNITGDASAFGDQFVSGRVPVEANKDYVLRLELALEEGLAAAKVMSSDRAVALESVIITGHERRRRLKKLSRDDETETRVDPKDRMAVFEMVFASNAQTDFRLVISNNGTPGPIMRLDSAKLFNLGPTPYQWSRYPRVVIHQLQNALFDTSAMLPLVVSGALLLAFAARGRALVVLLAVPAYYLCAQSALSTEYRYILAIHYFLFVIGAATIYCAGFATIRLTSSIYASARSGFSSRKAS